VIAARPLAAPNPPVRRRRGDGPPGGRRDRRAGGRHCAKPAIAAHLTTAGTRRVRSAVTCDAEITLVGAAGVRTIRAGEFFTGSLSTVRQAGEIITELHLPFWPRYRRWAFEEFGPHDAVPIGKFLAP
jgi:hypothetical protein